MGARCFIPVEERGGGVRVSTETVNHARYFTNCLLIVVAPVVEWLTSNTASVDAMASVLRGEFFFFFFISQMKPSVEKRLLNECSYSVGKHN